MKKWKIEKGEYLMDGYGNHLATIQYDGSEYMQKVSTILENVPDMIHTLKSVKSGLEVTAKLSTDRSAKNLAQESLEWIEKLLAKIE